MKIIKTALFVVGILAVLMGLLWIGQGTGVFPYPRESFMISQAPWIGRGAALAVAGLIMIVLSRFIRLAR